MGRRYEESADVAPRRSAGGVFYTPDHVVEYAVDATLPALLRDAPTGEDPTLRIVDPACGGGAFLVAAFRRLVRWTGGSLSARIFLGLQPDDDCRRPVRRWRCCWWHPAI